MQIIQQGRILEGVDLQIPGFRLKPIYNEAQLSISAETDNKNRRHRIKIGICGTKYFNTKSHVVLKNPTLTNGSPEPTFGGSELNEDSISGSDTFHPLSEFFSHYPSRPLGSF